ncbi:MAG: 4Fe-4S dicluster domain-containing protein [Gammaproteobacteria bacterium]
MGIFRGNRKTDGTFDPSWLYKWLRPEKSGNTINGLGESRTRRPTPVYHYILFLHPWWLWQNTFYFRTSLSVTYLRKIIRSFILRYSPFRPVAASRSKTDPATLSRQLTDFLLANGAGDVAVARMRPEWVLEGMPEVTEPFIVTFAVPMDYSTMMRVAETGCDLTAGGHIIDKYNRGTTIARSGANWLRDRGYHAYGHCGPASGRLTSIPAAIAGGLGELGKHGSMINRKYGSNFRIGYILTEAELVPGEPVNFGADEFCTNCQLCIKHCPPNAIYPEKQMVRGVQKWYVDFDRCVSYFNETYGCGICLPICPWSRPGVAGKLVAKMARRSTINS